MPLQVRFHVVADMGRNRHHADIFIALGAVDTAPLRFCGTILFGRV
jgi:hypothetical protein